MNTMSMRNTARVVVMNSAKTALFICGPTAVGKTSLAISLAQWLSTEILSFDSRQIYQELKIGSAPPSPSELAAVKHHFVASHSLSDTINAGIYEKLALKAIMELFQSRDNLVLVGGSGLYMKALTEGFDQIPEVDPAIREELNLIHAQSGLVVLQTELASKDPQYHQEVDLQNPQRVIRALEVIRSTGKPFSSFRRGTKQTRPFKTIKIGLNMAREVLYDRINERVDAMMAAGLEEEVRELKNYWDKAALKTVGYDELVNYIRGDIPLHLAIEEIKKNTRRYAKRQLTWFRRDSEIKWFQPHEIDMIKVYLNKQLN